MRLQSSLGGLNYNSRTDRDNQGKLSLAKVVKTYEKNNTADVVLLSGSYMGDNKVTDGVISCVQLERFSGRDSDLQVSFGSLTPLEIGEIVLIAFVDSSKARPVILGSLPSFNDNSLSINPTLDAEGEIVYEKGESVEVDRLQGYKYKNGLGESEDVEASRAFTVSKVEKMSDHREDGFMYRDLTLKNKYTGATIGLNKDKFESKPRNYLRVTKNTFDDERNSIYNRFYHDAERGITRFSKDGLDFLISCGVDENNTFEIKVQPTSYKRKRSPGEPSVYKHSTLRKSDRENNTLYDEEHPRDIYTAPKIEDITSIKIDKKGKLEILQQDKENVTRVVLDDKVSVKTSRAMELYADKDITIRSNTEINLLAPSVYTWDKDKPFVQTPLKHKDLEEKDED